MVKETSTEKAAGKEDGDDLSTILNQSQRAELMLLLVDIMDQMQQSLLATFDANAGIAQASNLKRELGSEKSSISQSRQEDIGITERQLRLKTEYQQDLATPQMQILKKFSLKAFEEWREQVLIRIGEVVNARHATQKPSDRPLLAKENADRAIAVQQSSTASDRSNTFKSSSPYPPQKNGLTSLTMEQRTLILHSVLLLMLSLKQYSAPSRVLLLYLTSSLELPISILQQDESITAKGLLEGVKALSAEEETKKKVEESKDSRKWKVGLATVAGATLIGITGGLAAPLVAAGVGTIMGGIGLGATSAATYLGTVAGSTYLIGGLFGAYGGRMTGNMMDNYAREVEDFEFLPVHETKKTSEKWKLTSKHTPDHDHKLHVSICISGWLTEKDEVLKPWRVLGTNADVFALKYELEAMLNLGNAISEWVQSATWGYAKKQLIARTIFADLSAALWPLGLLKAARVIDNPYNIAKTRSEKAGEVLADALINKAQGGRPVTLIGYSLGARVIYICLMTLAKRNAFGLIENAILIGSPTPSDTSDWRSLRAVVSGRLINVYSQNDFVLGFMYRTSSLQYGVAGLQPVQGLPGVENVDVSDKVSGHLRYRYLVGDILAGIGFEDVDMTAVQQEQEALAKMEEETKEKSAQAQQARLKRRTSAGATEDEGAEAEEEANEMEKEVKAKTKKSMLTKAMEFFYTPKSPSKEGPAVPDSEKTPTKDAEDSDQNLAQRAYAALPSMSSMGFSKNKVSEDSADSTSKPTNKTTDNKTLVQGSDTSKSGYLPSLPTSLPSIPGFTSRTKPDTIQST